MSNLLDKIRGRIYLSNNAVIDLLVTHISHPANFVTISGSVSPQIYNARLIYISELPSWRYMGI